MKRWFAFVCLMIPVMVACSTEPAEPAEPAEAAAAPAVAPDDGAADSLTDFPADSPADSPIGTLADEPCLNYCTGGGRTPFMTCVPVCRRDRKVIFSLEPVSLQIAPYCGDNICQFPDETTLGSRRYCQRDCRVPIEVTRNRVTINGKIIADAEGEDILMRSSAFDAEM